MNTINQSNTLTVNESPFNTIFGMDERLANPHQDQNDNDTPPSLNHDDQVNNRKQDQLKNKVVENRRFSVIEVEKWKNVFHYDPPMPTNQYHEAEEAELFMDHDENITTSHHHKEQDEDAQWREIFGCQTNYRERVVSAPIPYTNHPTKACGTVKRKSDPVQLPSTRRISVIETEKWKNMFACDADFDFRSRVPPRPTAAKGEDESWRQFFGCETNNTPSTAWTSSVKSSPAMTPPRSTHLDPITEKDTETTSSGSGDLPKPKLMTYIKSVIKSKMPKKKSSSK